MAGVQRFYRVPLGVDAMQFDGRNAAELDEWIAPGHFDFDPEAAPGDDSHVAVFTRKGPAGIWVPVRETDWILHLGDDRYRVVNAEDMLADFPAAGGA